MAKASTGGGKSSNPSSKTGNSNSSTSKASVGGAKASNPSTKTGSSATTSKASVGGAKASNPATKTGSSTNRTGSSTSSMASNRSSTGGGKSSNPATKTSSASVGGGKSSNPAAKVSAAQTQRIKNSVESKLSEFGLAIDKAFGVSETVANVKNMVNAAGGKLAKDMTQKKGFTKVVGAGPGWTEVENADGTVSRREGARNWRNNNPGNVEYGDFAKKHGAIGSDGRFAVFGSYEDGRKAKESLVFGSKNYKDKSIKDAIARYAPASENDSLGYAKQVADAAGVSLDTKMSSLSPAQRKAVLDRMERVEGFKVGKEIAMMDASGSMQRVNGDGVYTTTYNNAADSIRQENDGSFGLASIFGGVKNSLDSLAGSGGKSTTASSEVVNEAKPDRLGLGKLATAVEEKKPVEVVKTLAKAVRDPIGFVIDSIEDGVNQNGGFGANLAGTGSGYRDMLEPTRNGGNGNQKKQEVPEQQQVAEASVLPTDLVKPARQPFGWSQLLAGNQPKFIV